MQMDRLTDKVLELEKKIYSNEEKMKSFDDRFMMVLNSIDGLKNEVKLYHYMTENRLVEMDKKFSEKFVEMDKKFTDKFVEMDRRFVEIDRRFVEIDRKFVEMDKKLDNQVEIVKGKLVFPIMVMIFITAFSVVLINPLGRFLEHFLK